MRVEYSQNSCFNCVSDLFARLRQPHSHQRRPSPLRFRRRVVPSRRRDVCVLKDLRDDVDGQFLLVEGDGCPGAAVGVGGDAGGEAAERVAGALGFTDADAGLNGMPFGDLADRLRRSLATGAGEEDVGGLGVGKGIRRPQCSSQVGPRGLCRQRFIGLDDPSRCLQSKLHILRSGERVQQ